MAQTDLALILFTALLAIQNWRSTLPAYTTAHALQASAQQKWRLYLNYICAKLRPRAIVAAIALLKPVCTAIKTMLKNMFSKKDNRIHPTVDSNGTQLTSTT